MQLDRQVIIVQIIGLRMASRFANFHFMFAWCLDPWTGRRQSDFQDVPVNVDTPRYQLVIFKNKITLNNLLNIDQYGKYYIIHKSPKYNFKYNCYRILSKFNAVLNPDRETPGLLGCLQVLQPVWSNKKQYQNGTQVINCYFSS